MYVCMYVYYNVFVCVFVHIVHAYIYLYPDMWALFICFKDATVGCTQYTPGI